MARGTGGQPGTPPHHRLGDEPPLRVGVARREHSSAERTVAHRKHPGLRHCLEGLPNHLEHAQGQHPRHHQQVGVERRGYKTYAEVLEIIARPAQRAQL
jgi:hypothetical protein